jgi:aspartate-semialdehyde dehydrogenase
LATVSIVGGETPLGRELADVLKERKLRYAVQLIGAGEEAGTLLTEREGEATVMTALDAGRLRASDLVFLAGEPASTRKAAELAGGKTALADLTYTLEDLPEARLRCPLLEGGSAEAASRVSVLAHPAAVGLALMLGRLHKAHTIRHAVVQVFEPASERGKPGLNELQQQVTSLLSFRKMDKRVFDAQAGFNMLPRYGEDAPEKLEAVEARIERHLASLLRGAVPMPSLRLIQAPVFHGHSFLLWVEFESRPSDSAVAEALASAQIDVRGPDVEAPTNVGTAGLSGITAGVIEADRSHPRAVWIWAAADNYRVMADNAADLAASILEESAR